MKISIKSIAIQAVVIVLTVIITYIIITRQNNAAWMDAYGNSIGYELSWKIDMLEEANNEAATISKIRYSMERDILRLIMEASVMKPKIGDLQGTPIDAFHKIIEYQKSKGFLTSPNNETDMKVRQIATDYLSKIEPDISKRIKARKEVAQGLGEHLKNQFK
ncbi:MAG: hypothetical protein ACFFCW_39050 [Candidatus Hodarchaeota archaeon]